MATTDAPTAAPAAPPDQEQPQRRIRGDWISLSRSDVLTGIRGYDKKDQEDLLWLHGYALDVLKGSRSALVEWLGCTWTPIYKIWVGKYEAEIGQFMERVRHFRRKAELASKTTFIRTPLTDKIFKVCDAARDQGCMVMISGPSGRCKTHTVREWKRENNHGRSIYVYAPEYGGFRAFLEALAVALGVGRDRANYDLARAIENSLDYRNVLIIDELAHLYPNGKTSNLQSIEFIRGLHDRTGCGVVLVATDGLQQIMAGGKWGRWFEQLLGRVELHLRIPGEFSRREIADICSAYIDDPEPALIKLASDIANARKGGVRELIRHLTRAAQAAEKRGETLCAKHLAAAYQFAQDLVDTKE